MHLRRHSIFIRSFMAAAAFVVASVALPAAHAGEVDDDTKAAAARALSFRNDVMPVLAKAGCNAGACHGNARGKGGFKLSLRGEDPDRDYRTLTRGLFARRVDPLSPDDSLMLRKATAKISHEGGKRFDADSPYYRTVRDWIAQGVPGDDDDTPRLTRLEVTPGEAVLIEPKRDAQLRATAHFSDGTQRDVTHLAVYELSNTVAEVSADGNVTAAQPGETVVVARFLDKQAPSRLAFVPARPDFSWQPYESANYIDEHILAKLRTLRVNPSPRCDDRTFVRRVYLDIIGLPPTAEEARAFVRDDHPDKRSKLIDVLIERPEFADHWALKWSDVLRNEEKVIDVTGVAAFHNWIRDSIAEGKPLDQFVRQLLTTTGSTYKEPATNFYRANRDPSIRAEAAAQLFLGARLQCAKCHNHPFDQWKQEEYYQFAAVFAPVKYKIVENKRKDKYDKSQFIGEQLVSFDGDEQVKHPDSGKVMQPKFIGGPKPKTDDGKARLQALAKWLTSPDNPRFARVQANRIWYHLMGRGLIDPVDDLRATNPPSHPELLDALAVDFIKSGFDLRHMVRVICNSRAYQLSSMPNATNGDDERNYSRAVVRRLTAEQLLDAMSVALDTPIRFNGHELGVRAGQLPGVNKVYRDREPSPGDLFLKQFGRPLRLTVCECERANDTTLGQVFTLTSGPIVNDLLTAKDNRISRLIDMRKNDRFIIDELYWSALSRPPSEVEMRRGLALIEQTKDRREAIEDIAWGLVNAKAFLLRR